MTSDTSHAAIATMMARGSAVSTMRKTLLTLVLLLKSTTAFVGLVPVTRRSTAWSLAALPGSRDEPPTRRVCLQKSWHAASLLVTLVPSGARAESSMFAPEFVQQYQDFTVAPEGWSYRDVTEGMGTEKASAGDRVVFDWSGYTIGYFGRPFQAKGGPQGGAFDKDLDYARTVVGSGTMVKGLESALIGMKPGGVRQIVVPYGECSYPANDRAHDRVGPKPSTFSGQRALNFVLENPRLDRTLLFNVKVVRIDKPNGKGGFTRG